MSSQTEIRQILTRLANVNDKRELERHCYGGLTEEDRRELAARDVETYSGKVRDVIFRGDELLIVHSDRLSAFDRAIGLVPFKGTILTDISAYWLEKATEVVETHLVDRPAERILRVERCEPVKAEVIVRGYLAGSMLRAYQKGERVFCGARLPDGLEPYGRLPEPILTPTTKAEAFEHDEDTTPDELVARGIVTRTEWDEIARQALALFALGGKVYSSLGWILVDTKYEFGRSKDGRIKVIDEIHTPDSSRLWVEATYESRLAQGEAPEMLDKEVVRRYLLDQGFSGHGPVPDVPAERLTALAEVYLRVAEKLRGAPLTTSGEDTRDALNRLL